MEPLHVALFVSQSNYKSSILKALTSHDFLSKEYEIYTQKLFVI